MLIDMELLAHTDYLVASDRSKWSKILQYMRYILYGASCTPHSCSCMHPCSRKHVACKIQSVAVGEAVQMGASLP